MVAHIEHGKAIALATMKIAEIMPWCILPLFSPVQNGENLGN